MGWLFGWHTRKELADHLVRGNGVHTLKHCFKGNNLWAVQECTFPELDWEGKPHAKAGQTERFIALYLIRGNSKSRDRWGYKDMEESSGPYYYNCPLAYLDMVPDPGGYATEWRAKVREHWAARQLKLKVGQRVMVYGNEYTVTADLGRRGYQLNHLYRLGVGQLKDVLISTQDPGV